MKTIGILVTAGWVLLLAVGCGPKYPLETDYDAPLPPGELALRKVTNPAEWPDITAGCYSLKDLDQAVSRSLEYFQHTSSRKYFPYGGITHDKAVASLRVFLNLLREGRSPRELGAEIEKRFDAYVSVGCDGKGTVLFTGYYTPIFNASPGRTDRFQWPLYKQPPDLVKDANGKVLGRRKPDGTTVPYPSRAEIESSGMLSGQELVWLEDPFEAYVAHVQGSAKLRLPNGRVVTVGYAATNGHDYQGIVKQMIEDGALPARAISLGAMIDYFEDHPDKVKHYTNLNPRYVFFRFEEGNPRGSLNVPVTALRSIATDKAIYPRGCLAFIEANLPRPVGHDIKVRRYRGFALDQDSGGAIRAPGRCDVYMGQGHRAGLLAGRTYQEGRLYYLFLKDEPEQKPPIPKELLEAPATQQ